MKMLERNKKSRVGIVLVSISIFLLLVYGTDAILDKTDEGFLPFDVRVRGIVLGIPIVVLPLIAFVITWSSPSKFLSLFLLMNGMLIVIGSTLTRNFSNCRYYCASRKLSFFCTCYRNGNSNNYSKFLEVFKILMI